MTISTSRKVAITVFAAATALGLAACSPPNEQDSDHKVDTATSQNPDSLPGKADGATTTSTKYDPFEAALKSPDLIAKTAQDGTPFYSDCNANAQYQPNRIVLNCKDQNDFAENIVWEDWSEEIAHGTATRTREGKDPVANAQITLSAPKAVDGTMVFGNVTIDGVNVNPQTDY